MGWPAAKRAPVRHHVKSFRPGQYKCKLRMRGRKKGTAATLRGARHFSALARSEPRACRQISQIVAAARWSAARKFRAVLS